MNKRTILIRLLDEGTNVYVEGLCEPIGEDRYRVSEVSETFGAEAEFFIGDEIALEVRKVGGIDKRVAVSIH